MEGRQRSPSYPSTPLGEAIEITRKLYSVERSNAVDRDVAAKAMGYSGISGRSATILSNLLQYGLLEKTGKSEVRVSRRSIDILFPDSEASSRNAMREAALEPELFQKIRQRFNDGIPSEASLEAYLVRQGFTHTAIPPATKAYRETFLFLEDAIGGESHFSVNPDVVEPQQNQQVEKSVSMPRMQPPSSVPTSGSGSASEENGPAVHFAQRKIWLGGVITNRAEAEDLIATINALKGMLRTDKQSEVPPPPNGPDDYGTTD